MSQFQTGQWEIGIDDLDGELAMDMTDRVARKIEVVEEEVFSRLFCAYSASKNNEEKLFNLLGEADEALKQLMEKGAQGYILPSLRRRIADIFIARNVQVNAGGSNEKA